MFEWIKSSQVHPSWILKSWFIWVTTKMRRLEEDHLQGRRLSLRDDEAHRDGLFIDWNCIICENWELVFFLARGLIILRLAFWDFKIQSYQLDSFKANFCAREPQTTMGGHLVGRSVGRSVSRPVHSNQIGVKSVSHCVFLNLSNSISSSRPLCRSSVRQKKRGPFVAWLLHNSSQANN